jgi:hypothetical protein
LHEILCRLWIVNCYFDLQIVVMEISRQFHRHLCFTKSVVIFFQFFNPSLYCFAKHTHVGFLVLINQPPLGALLSANIHTAILGFCSGDFATPSKLIEVTPFARLVVVIVELTNRIQFKMCCFLHLMMFMLNSIFDQLIMFIARCLDPPYLSV